MESFGSIHSEPSLLDSEKGSAHSVATHGSRRLTKTAQSVVVLMVALPAVPPASLKSTCLCWYCTELYPGGAQDYSN